MTKYLIISTGFQAYLILNLSYFPFSLNLCISMSSCTLWEFGYFFYISQMKNVKMTCIFLCFIIYINIIINLLSSFLILGAIMDPTFFTSISTPNFFMVLMRRDIKYQYFMSVFLGGISKALFIYQAHLITWNMKNQQNLLKY